ncbi:MAG: 50S ribosomal protein L4 [Nitrospinae bacterium CG22_combo_CG10-13_8_21_14_all_47_10]|jgi:large subunit ribosomal protein L4|nr:MAG: 50S ribosomal protein L4 [Nitrospinae bacterium CG22_combo_CG10-13_8_21_14_all_47_10]
MPALDIVDSNNKKVGTVEALDSVFGSRVSEVLVQRYVTMQLAARRGGNAATKQNKGELHGSNAKPWRQKGTGRARSGTTRSPIWRGGLTVFGPGPRSYAFQLSKKSKKLAIKSVLTERLKGQNFTVVDSLNLEKPKTKDAVALLASLNLPEKTLFLISEKNTNLQLAVRNLPRVDVLLVDGLNVFDLLAHERIVCTPEALKKIEERLN